MNWIDALRFKLEWLKERKGKLDSKKDVQFCTCINESINAKLVS